MKAQTMGSPLEADVAGCVADYLRLRRVWFFRPHGHLGQLPGVPDFIGCWCGRFLAIECKAPRPLNTAKQIAAFLAPQQRAQLWSMAEAGALVIVATDVDHVRQAIEAAERR